MTKTSATNPPFFVISYSMSISYASVYTYDQSPLSGVG